MSSSGRAMRLEKKRLISSASANTARPTPAEMPRKVRQAPSMLSTALLTKT